MIGLRLGPFGGPKGGGRFVMSEVPLQVNPVCFLNLEIRGGVRRLLQEYLAHTKLPTPLGLP